MALAPRANQAGLNKAVEGRSREAPPIPIHTDANLACLAEAFERNLAAVMVAEANGPKKISDHARESTWDPESRRNRGVVAWVAD